MDTSYILDRKLAFLKSIEVTFTCNQSSVSLR